VEVFDLTSDDDIFDPPAAHTAHSTAANTCSTSTGGGGSEHYQYQYTPTLEERFGQGLTLVHLLPNLRRF